MLPCIFVIPQVKVREGHCIHAASSLCCTSKQHLDTLCTDAARAAQFQPGSCHPAPWPSMFGPYTHDGCTKPGKRHSRGVVTASANSPASPSAPRCPATIRSAPAPTTPASVSLACSHGTHKLCEQHIVEAPACCSTSKGSSRQEQGQAAL